jgi:hypothetical protein
MMLYPKRVYSSIRLYADLTCRIVTGNGVVKSTENFMPTYHVHMDSLCTYHAHELTKFTKKFKKIHTCSFHPTPSVYKISTSNF